MNDFQCDDPGLPTCGSGGDEKTSWPNVVGMTVPQATAIILHDQPKINVVPYPESTISVLPEPCCNRVLVPYDKNHRVSGVPKIG
ncbi:hypothetical protein CASFOL_024937 [Castilleja foliolosa]|uniref:Uncharacterized protein n=1 Tax=Castilleja foliolosa TaxID=1961234 RepID=A0ABD3CQP1_9LAMI